jgi:hypothetical protein
VNQTTVVNRYKEPYDVLIMRPSMFGNRHHIGPDGDRHTVIRKHKRDFAARVESDVEFRREVFALRGKRLGCVCRPQACHGDSIVEFLTLGVADPETRVSARIDGFQGYYRFLSNFWYAVLCIDDKEYQTSEHYFHAMKCVDDTDAEYIRNLDRPGEAKQCVRSMGYKPDFKESNNDLAVMFTGVLAKFEQNSSLAEKLVATGDALLIEGNRWHDNYWGRCTCAKCRNYGHNHLGRVLMTVRGILGGSI